MNTEPSTSSRIKRKRSNDSDEENNLTANYSEKSVKWTRKQTEDIEIKYHWVIKNFSQLLQSGAETLTSAKFFSGRDQYKWRMKLDPQHGSKIYIGVDIILPENPENPTVTASIELSLLNSDNRVLCHKTFHPRRVSESSPSIGRRIDKSVVQVDQLLPSNELHVNCKITYKLFHPKFTGIYNSGIKTFKSTKGSLAHRFKTFEKDFQNLPFSDVKIQVGKSIYKAHKIVLATGSPVFNAMLQSTGFTEKKTNIIKIDDLDSLVVKELLRFLYTDQVDEMTEELAKDLLMAADKYMVDLLKINCQTYLSATISIDNCSRLLLFADSHSAIELKKAALDFILQNAENVVKSQDWKVLKLNHPQLCLEVSDALMCSSSLLRKSFHDRNATSSCSSQDSDDSDSDLNSY